MEIRPDGQFGTSVATFSHITLLSKGMARKPRKTAMPVRKSGFCPFGMSFNLLMTSADHGTGEVPRFGPGSMSPVFLKAAVRYG